MDFTRFNPAIGLTGLLTYLENISAAKPTRFQSRDRAYRPSDQASLHLPCKRQWKFHSRDRAYRPSDLNAGLVNEGRIGFNPAIGLTGLLTPLPLSDIKNIQQ